MSAEEDKNKGYSGFSSGSEGYSGYSGFSGATFSHHITELRQKADDSGKVPLEDVAKEFKADYDFHHDKWIFRSVVWILGGIVISVLLIYFYKICNCQCDKSELSSGIIAIGATAVGALAGLISIGNKK